MINSNKDEYSLNYFENNFISKREFISYMISDCDQVITQENVTDFAKSFEALVLAIFPEGHNSNAKARKYQKEDFSLSVTPNRPLLEQIKESKEFLINTLISKLTKLGFISLSIRYHKKYRELFYVPAATILAHCKNIEHLECLEINDLTYLKQISSQSILHFNCNEQFFNAKNTILKFIDSLGDDDKKH